MLSTIHRRHILSLFEERKSLTFTELKRYFLDTKEMNPTTLYRIIEAFRKEGLLHEISVGNERIFTLCHGHQDEGVKLSYCTKCTSISESHFPLAPEALKSESIEYLRTCPHCS